MVHKPFILWWTKRRVQLFVTEVTEPFKISIVPTSTPSDAKLGLGSVISEYSDSATEF